MPIQRVNEESDLGSFVHASHVEGDPSVQLRESIWGLGRKPNASHTFGKNMLEPRKVFGLFALRRGVAFSRLPSHRHPPLRFGIRADASGAVATILTSSGRLLLLSGDVVREFLVQ